MSHLPPECRVLPDWSASTCYNAGCCLLGQLAPGIDPGGRGGLVELN
jgi:hypothetical protein